MSAALVLALFTLTLLAWSAIPYSNSGLATYAVSDSLVRYARWDLESVRWLGEAHGSRGVGGWLYHRQAPAVSALAAPLAWLGLHLPDIGPVHAALLLMPLVHALTAVYLFHTARTAFPSVSRAGALNIATIWAFGSPALPYVRTFSGEPLVALALLAAIFHLLNFGQDGRGRHALLVGFWLGLAFLAHPRYAVVISFFALGLLLAARRYWLLRPIWQEERPRAASAGTGLWSWISDDWMLARLLAFGTPMLFSAALYHWYNWYRFGRLFDNIFPGDGGMPYDRFLFLVLFDPGSGLVWYAPWMFLLVLLVLPRVWQDHGALASLVLGVTATILFVNSRLVEPDNYLWGARYLLPTLPLFALMITPLWSFSFPPGRMLIPSLGIASFLVTVIGVLWGFARLPLQPAWLVGGTPGMRMLALLLFMAFVATAVAAWIWSRQADHVLLVAGVLLVGCGLWLYLGDLRAFQTPDLSEALTQLPAPLPPAAEIWYNDPEMAVPLLNLIKARVPFRGFDLSGDEAHVQRELERAQRLAQNVRNPIFLIGKRDSDGTGRLEQVLQEHLFFVEERGSRRHRIAEYWQGPLEQGYDLEAQVAFSEHDPIARLRRVNVTPEVERGGVLALEAHWVAERELESDYHVWLQLRNDDGEVVLQRNAPPAPGQRLASTWKPEETIVERHAFRLPTDLAPELYTLHLGLAHPRDDQLAEVMWGGEEVVIQVQVR